VSDVISPYALGRVHRADCLEAMAALPEASISAVITDPPYGLGFMGRKWDAQPPGSEIPAAMLRVAKPGAHLVAFGGTGGWFGWGTALKPAWEPVVLARKPLEGAVAANAQKHGTGALNIEAGRIGTTKQVPRSVGKGPAGYGGGWGPRKPEHGGMRPDIGRWPANLALDEAAAEMLDEQSGYPHGNKNPSPRGGYNATCYRVGTSGDRIDGACGCSGGGASRFFYVAKASRSERDAGQEGFAPHREADRKRANGPGGDNPRNRTNIPVRNFHPTVKPLALMRWLVRLVAPPGGIVLDPFAGSGTTGCACEMEGVAWLGFDREAGYCEIAGARVKYWRAVAEARGKGLTPVEYRAGQKTLFGGET